MTGKKRAAEPVRLNRAMIVDAAIRVAARRDSRGLTGQEIGSELGVDRTAMWRHFENRDALLRAVADHLIGMALRRVPANLPPRERLVAIGRALIDVFAEHPHVGAEIGVRVVYGPNAFAVVEQTLTALDELGIPETDVPRYQQMLSEVVMAVASAEASFALLPAETRASEEQQWGQYPSMANSKKFPALGKYGPAIVQITSEQIFATMIDSLLLGIGADDSRSRTRSPHPPPHNTKDH